MFSIKYAQIHVGSILNVWILQTFCSIHYAIRNHDQAPWQMAHQWYIQTPLSDTTHISQQLLAFLKSSHLGFPSQYHLSLFGLVPPGSIILMPLG